MNNRTNDQAAADFIRAVRHNDFHQVQCYLNKHAATPEKFNDRFHPNGYTALHYAVLNNNEPLIKALLIAGVDVNIRDNGGNTPLVLAAKYLKFEAIHLLSCVADLDISTRNKQAQDAFQVLSIALFLPGSTSDTRRKLTECCEALSFASILSPHERVLCAAQVGNDVTIQRYIRLNPSAALNIKNEFGRTALAFAAGARKPDIVKSLVNAGADVNTADNLGITPLIAATLANDIDTVSQLLAAPAIDLFQSNIATRQNAFQIATSKGYSQIAYLIEKTAIKQGKPIHQPVTTTSVSAILPPTPPAPSSSQRQAARHWSLFAPTKEQIQAILGQATEQATTPAPSSIPKL